jgi:hypothetical protein
VYSSLKEVVKVKKEERFVNKFQSINIKLDSSVADRLIELPNLSGIYTI